MGRCELRVARYKSVIDDDTFVLGDLHGRPDRAIELLKDGGVVDAVGAWVAGSSRLWFLGDLVDRGPDGLGAIQLVMRLQSQARAAGGTVECLLGNHELALLAAYHFGSQRSSGPGGTFVAEWQHNGGTMADLDHLTPELVDWLSSRPAMALVDDRLFIHADATVYRRYGDSIAEVNQKLAGIIADRHAEGWNRLLGEFSEHDAFLDRRPGGVERAREYLRIYGGFQLVHGHSPVSRSSGISPSDAREPMIYADGLCVNVDPGLYLGGPGFLHRLPSLVISL